MLAENLLKQARKSLLSNRGQSIVEIALITPLLLAVLYVAFDFGLAYFTAHYTQNAVREAARYAGILGDCAVLNPPPTCITAGTVGPQSCPGTDPVVQAACQRIPNLLTGAQVTVNLSGTFTSLACRRMVTVSATGAYSYGFYNLMALIGKPPANTTGSCTAPSSAYMCISRSAEARYEIQPVSSGPANC
jgi:Flp pilus assembly protein TadG